MIFYLIQRNFFKSKLLKSKKEEQNKTETEIENDLDDFNYEKERINEVL